MWIPCVALCTLLSAGCAAELGSIGEGIEETIAEPGGLIDCPRAAWSFIEPSSWVLDGVWMGGEFVYREVLIGDALADPESPLIELKLELAALANNAELGFDVPDDVRAAATELDEWFTRQRSGAHDATAEIVGSDLADRLRGSSLEAALSCFDAVTDRVASSF